MRQTGLIPDENLCAWCRREHYAEDIKEFFDNLNETPDAILASAGIATEVLAHFFECHGERIPKRLAILAFNDSTLTSGEHLLVSKFSGEAEHVTGEMLSKLIRGEAIEERKVLIKARPC
jgi:DNA-binding LacI/PurR family transcriptional regulator